jgi:hypothetical protein
MGNNGAHKIPRYCWPNHHRTFPVFHCRNQAFRVVGFLGCSLNVNSSWEEQREGRPIWALHAFPVVWCPGFVVVTSEHCFQYSEVSQLNPYRYRGVGFVKLTSDSFPWYGIFKINIQFCCGSSVIFRNNPSECTIISFDQYWFSPTVPLRWCCLPTIRVCRHNLRNCRSR